MENASKALLMAAGVLMGTLILSLAVYLFSTFRATANDNYDRMREEEIAQFNSFYLDYEGRTNLTYYDIWSVINKAKDYNEKNKDDAGAKIGVFFGLTEITDSQNDIKSLRVALGLDEQESIRGKISGSDSEGNFSLQEYTCSKIELNDVGRVNKITFVKTT